MVFPVVINFGDLTWHVTNKCGETNSMSGFGLQFYITTRAELDYLDEKHTVCNSILVLSNLGKILRLKDFASLSCPINIHGVGVLVAYLVYVLFQVFGEIAEGLDTLTRINETFVDENFRPYKNIR